jgi:hypothetical protein
MKCGVRKNEGRRKQFIVRGGGGSADLGYGRPTPPWAHLCGAHSRCHLTWNPSKIMCQLDCRMTEAPVARIKMNGAH